MELPMKVKVPLSSPDIVEKDIEAVVSVKKLRNLKKRCVIILV